MGWIMLFVVTAGIGWVANLRQRRTGWGMVWVGLCSSLVFQLLAAWQLGHVDPFALVAFLVSLLVTLPLSWAVGWLVWRQRGRDSRDDEI
jgi:L-lactate permease